MARMTRPWLKASGGAEDWVGAAKAGSVGAWVASSGVRLAVGLGEAVTVAGCAVTTLVGGRAAAAGESENRRQAR